MTKSNIEALNIRTRLIRQVREEMKLSGLSRAAAGRQIGVSTTTVSQWLADKYGGNMAETDSKMERWLNRQRDSRQISTTAAGLDIHRDLIVSRRIETVLLEAQTDGNIAVVVGRSGMGKTAAARNFTETGSGVFITRMTGAVRSAPGMLRIIAQSLGAAPADRSALAAEQAVIERLKGRGALLIVDEAHHLSARLIDELRCIRDLADAGLALMGDTALLATLQRCPQVLGRCGRQYQAPAADEGDIDTLITPILRRDPSHEEIRVCRAVAAGPGGLHTLRRVLQAAWRKGKMRGDQDGIAPDLLVPVAGRATRVDAPADAPVEARRARA